MQDRQKKWSTEISDIGPNKLIIRGYRLEDLIEKATFIDCAYLALIGALPNANQKRMLDAITVAAIDHGASPPSTLAARTVISTGGQYNTALAAGILSINRFHGGAVEDCFNLLQKLVEEKQQKGNGFEIAINLVKEYRSTNKKLPGFGHRMHTADPRVLALSNIAAETNHNGQYLQMSFMLERAVKQVLGRTLPMNVDGMIAALLCELNFPPELANMVFIMARVPGLIAHIYEEDKTQKKMRKIDPVNYEYAGTAERTI